MESSYMYFVPLDKICIFVPLYKIGPHCSLKGPMGESEQSKGMKGQEGTNLKTLLFRFSSRT
jgi:hypothetical protein